MISTSSRSTRNSVRGRSGVCRMLSPRPSRNWSPSLNSKRRQRALMKNHPVDTEPILHLRKAEGKESLFHRHQDPSPIGKRGENLLCLYVAIHSQRQVSAAHRFSVWDVCCHQFRVANRNAGVQHRVLPFRAHRALVGRLRVRHHHANLCSEMPLVVAEGLGAFATEIHVSIHSHNLVSSFQNSPILSPEICLCSEILDFRSSRYDRCFAD